MVWVKLPPQKKKRALSRSGSSFRSSGSVFDRDDSNSGGGGGSSEAFSQDGSRVAWAWKRGFILRQEADALVVQLLPEEDQYETSKNGNNLPPDGTLTFAPSALGELVLLTNDFETDEEGIIVPPDDLISLTHLNEPAVLESLWARYYQDKIYTNTGSVLLALNPFQNVRGLYGETAMKSHWQRAEKGHASPPHVYGIADAAFRSMRRQLELNQGNVAAGLDEDLGAAHQSILVSGESGAGKTVTTKFVMKYLAALSQRSSQHKHIQPEGRAYFKAAAKAHGTDASSPTGSTGDGNLASLTLLSGSSSIEGQVLQSNPILESFGNARTVRNDNSSRFGKFIEIQFSEQGQLVGASIETYLLEKVRLVHQSAGERNYHIFYELLGGGMDARQLSHYFIAQTAHPEDFKLTASGTYDRRDGVTDRETYKALRHACAAMKFSNHELHSVFCVTAALLHASNLTLVESPHEESCSLDTTNVHLTPVCHLLGVTPEDLERALCQQTIVIRHDETVTRTLNLDKAVKCLEALLKAIYGALFEYLVHRINDIVAYRHPDEEEEGQSEPRHDPNRPVASVRVLDIFGFESFHVNSFEQLCINYCNETLQQQFNAFVLKNEQAEYDREGIEWSFIAFEENQDVLDLIDKRGQGILSILDDQCRTPGPSDKAFLSQVYKTCKDHSRFSVSRVQEADNQFAIQHYAGCVEYTTYGFVEKNRDELSKEGTELVRNSQNPFLQLLAEIMEDSAFEPPPPIGSPQTPSLRRADSAVGRFTVGSQFRRQLKHLRTKIDETTPHYIRCLKPNDLLVPDHFDVSVVAEQLRCGGILEAVRVARAGFTQHYLHADFCRRYRSLAWREIARKETAVCSSNFIPQAARRPAPLSPTRPRSLFDEGGDAKLQCKELIRILYRRIEKYSEEETKSVANGGDTQDWNDDSTVSSSPAKARSYSYASSGTRPSWSKTPSPKSPAPSPRETPRWKAGSSDFAKVGIQLGKTKVFLRHKAFEVLERIRSRAQSRAATLLNSIFRMYLARMAYIPYRDAFRRELTQKRKNRNPFTDEFKETKDEYDARYDDQFNRPAAIDDNASTVLRFRTALRSPLVINTNGPSLVDKWEESQIRNVIHNHAPRHEWGKSAPSNHGSFKWVLSDGLWIRNFDVAE